MRYTFTAAVAVVMAALLAGCGGGGAGTSPTLTPTAPPEVIIEGKSYPQAYGTCAQGLWDERVNEWNQLVQQRDATGAAAVVVDGQAYADQAAYFTAKRWPVTLAGTLDAAATKSACPAK